MILLGNPVGLPSVDSVKVEGVQRDPNTNVWTIVVQVMANGKRFGRRLHLYVAKGKVVEGISKDTVQRLKYNPEAAHVEGLVTTEVAQVDDAYDAFDAAMEERGKFEDLAQQAMIDAGMATADREPVADLQAERVRAVD